MMNRILNMALPSCSVVIATRNRPRLLQATVTSVLRQSVRPQELIIVDDCSEDSVQAALTDCDFGDISLHRRRLRSHSGAAVARNEGASCATSDILMFLDDDDTWGTNKIETQLQLLKTHPKVGVVYTGMLLVDTTHGGSVLSVSRLHHSGKGWPQILFRNFVGPTSAVAVRSHLFHEVGGFDPALQALQDYDLWLRLCRRTEILYDGRHNLRFGAVHAGSDRISTHTSKYETAFRHLKQKYRGELSALGPLQERRFLAQCSLLLSTKHLQQRHVVRAGRLLLHSITLYPPTVLRVLSSLAARVLISRRAGRKALGSE